MAGATRAQVLRLYRAMLRESQQFSAYGYRYGKAGPGPRPRRHACSEARERNAVTGMSAFCTNMFRMYAIRRIRDAFRENKNLKDSAEIETLLKKAKTNLEMIHRQVTIGQLYSAQKLVIECQEKL